MKKILILGDSIRQGYDKYVKMAFQDVAEVYYPSDNCRFSAYIVRHLIDWKKQLECGDDVDLVHWNAVVSECLKFYREDLSDLMQSDILRRINFTCIRLSIELMRTEVLKHS